MSIIIKGMAMPQGNAECVEIYIYGDGTVFARQKKAVNGRKINGVEAVELPPHGRLIDADALRHDLKDSIDECQNWADAVEPDTTMYARISQSFGTFVECSLRVKAAPTIIEAEEAEQ